ncbi:MAG: hypothetical protein U1F48_08425 [Burkholderiales bacterium]
MVGAAEVARAVCACLALAAAGAGAQDFTVTGNCRDGLPHGAYELRGGGGQVRAVGAFNRGKRMGSFLFWTESGARLAQLPYDEDVLNGNVAAWYAPAARRAEQVQRLEANYAQGALAGPKRSWYTSGRDRTDLRYDAGTLAAARAFAENGNALAEADARALARRDEAADARFVETLEALVRSHLPRCDPASDRLEKG